MGGKPRGRSSTCEQTDNGPNLTSQNYCSPMPWDKRCEQYVRANSNLCVYPEVPTGTLPQPSWQPPFLPPPPGFLTQYLYLKLNHAIWRSFLGYDMLAAPPPPLQPPIGAGR